MAPPKVGAVSAPTAGGTAVTTQQAQQAHPARSSPRSTLELKWSKLYDVELELIELVIIELFQRVVPKDGSLYLFPSIPENKLANAEKAYADITSSELLLGLIDNTLFGSATDGCIITTRRIYWHNTFEDTGKKKYEEICPADVTPAIALSGKRVMLTPTTYLAIATLSKETIEGVATFVKHAAAFTLAARGCGRDPHVAALAALSDAWKKGHLDRAMPEVLRSLLTEDAMIQSKQEVSPTQQSQSISEDAASPESVVQPTIGGKKKGFFGKLFSFFVHYNCPNCNERSGEEIGRTLLDRKQEWATTYEDGRWVQRVHNIRHYLLTVRCQDCGHEWEERKVETDKA